MVDREGLDALSMRKLGEELGVEAMSLYRYVANKAALLDGVVEAVLSEMVVREPDSRAWTERVKARARALREAMMRHPAAMPLFATRPAVTPSSLAHVEDALELLRTAGFSTVDAIRALQSVLAFTVGNTVSVFSVLPSSERSSPAYEALSRRDFTRVHEAAAALEDWDSDAEFEYGLDALVRGLDALRREEAKGDPARPVAKKKKAARDA